MADVHRTTATGKRPGTGVSCKTTILMTSRQVKAGDLRDRAEAS
jgi:hypothetical protein